MVLPYPICQFRGAQRRRVHIQPTFHQTPNLFTSDHNVVHNQPDQAAAPITKHRGDGDNRPPHTKRIADSDDQLTIRERLGTNSLKDLVATTLCLLGGERGEIIHVYRLQSVISRPENSKGWKMA